jgi:hypothetical protein
LCAEAKLPELPQQGWTAASPQHPPPVHTPPLEATQRDADSANREISFGRPKLLSSLDEVVPSSSPTSPPASSPPSDSDLTPSSLSAHPSLALSSHSSEKAPVRGYDTDDEAISRVVPSSNTPSPLKLPSEQTDPAARALHESISNLLGKRNAGAMAIEDLAEPPQRRKRARPRFKVSSGSLVRSSRARVFIVATFITASLDGHERRSQRFLHQRPTGKYPHYVICVRGRTRERALEHDRRAGRRHEF